MVNASRPISRGELEACRAANREPLEFRVGNDAVAIVVSQANDTVQNVTLAQLGPLFTDAAPVVGRGCKLAQCADCALCARHR